jgi:dynein heavy chain
MSDFVEMKSFQKPPPAIRLTMDAVCIMMHQKGKKNEKGGIDYWDDARKMLADPAGFIKRLEKYDRDNIAEAVINKMKSFLDTNGKAFTPAIILKASVAAEGLCKWCLAIYDYYFVHKSILPLRENLAEANKKLEAANRELQKKRDLLAEVERKCQSLRDQFESANL